MKLVSTLQGGGYHSASGANVPAAGEAFVASIDVGAQLIAAGLAELGKLHSKLGETQEQLDAAIAAVKAGAEASAPAEPEPEPGPTKAELDAELEDGVAAVAAETPAAAAAPRKRKK